ncbi:Holliday junction resolvase RuvX [Clostridiales bacterium COT073_COT-073]|nr:Holliday junction resolvase RuvX [Clostridiales bacterium COT073_COT-073]
MRVMACDYGSKTIGIAVSDPFGWTAQGIEIIRRKEEKDLTSSFERIKELIAEYAVEKVVVGLPKNMNNTEGERVEKTLEFVEKLKQVTSLPIITWDERLSTAGAERVLLEADLSRAKRKKVIDKMAAAYFLQGYLDAGAK